MFGKSLWAEERPIPRHLPVEAQGIYLGSKLNVKSHRSGIRPESVLCIAFTVIGRSMAICIPQIVLYLRADRLQLFCFTYTVGICRIRH